MSDRIFLVNVEPPELRVAELREGKLFDLDIERDGRMLGNTYKGTVENVLPGMDAAFVNIGEKRNALLYMGDLVPEGTRATAIGDLVKPGQEVLVQVARPAVGGKGARVTTRLSFPGRYCIIITNSETSGVSKRIDSEEERGRLRRLADKLRPLDHGLIMRTEAEGASEAQISADVEFLLQQLEKVKLRAAGLKTPALLHRDLGLLGRLARDRMRFDVAAIHVDSLEAVEILREQLRTFSPTLADRVNYHPGPEQIFAKFGIAAQVESASLHKVTLPHGGSVVLDEAEALTAIDINTGSFVGRRGLGDTVLQTNLEAVEEIARQLRLRDIGGIVVVDFIDMERTRDRVKVLNALEAAVKDDRAKTRIVQISPSGLVEMTRRRESQTLRNVLSEPCSRCGGLGHLPRASTLAIDARRAMRERILAHPATGILAVFHPEIACEVLGEDGEWLKEMEAQTGGKIWIRVDFSLNREQSRFEKLAPGLALSGDIIVGSTVPLPPDSPLFPSVMPQFAVVGQTLVHVPGLADLPAQNRYLIQIMQTGRHYAEGRISGK